MWFSFKNEFQKRKLAAPAVTKGCGWCTFILLSGEVTVCLYKPSLFAAATLGSAYQRVHFPQFCLLFVWEEQFYELTLP